MKSSDYSTLKKDQKGIIIYLYGVRITGITSKKKFIKFLKDCELGNKLVRHIMLHANY